MEPKFKVGDLICNTRSYPESCFLVKDKWRGLIEQMYTLYDVKTGEFLDSPCVLIDPYNDKIS